MAGAKGGNARRPMFGGGGEGGHGGGALQIAACRDLVLAGRLSASGDGAFQGQDGYAQSSHSPSGTDGGGGGSGGTLLVETTRVRRIPTVVG
ncbi:hypothetical protein LVJ94_26980 [Pendulispora rubella]|uniref:Uncharacterized protein n=1 Tax=Pendulispora rubella TaxID=2741070 RepID=A0ABZ2LIS6_9BACT